MSFGFCWSSWKSSLVLTMESCQRTGFNLRTTSTQQVSLRNNGIRMQTRTSVLKPKANLKACFWLSLRTARYSYGNLWKSIRFRLADTLLSNSTIRRFMKFRNSNQYFTTTYILLQVLPPKSSLVEEITRYSNLFRIKSEF